MNKGSNFSPTRRQKTENGGRIRPWGVVEKASAGNETEHRAQKTRRHKYRGGGEGRGGTKTATGLSDPGIESDTSEQENVSDRDQERPFKGSKLK